MITERVLGMLYNSGLSRWNMGEELTRLFKSDLVAARKKTQVYGEQVTNIRGIAKNELVKSSGIVQDYWMRVRNECEESRNYSWLSSDRDLCSPCSDSLIDLECAGVSNKPNSTIYAITLTKSLDSVLAACAHVSPEVVRGIPLYDKMSYYLMRDMYTIKWVESLQWMYHTHKIITDFFDKVAWSLDSNVHSADICEIPAAIKYYMTYCATNLMLLAGERIYKEALAAKGKFVVKSQGWDTLIVSISGYSPPTSVTVLGVNVNVVNCSSPLNFASYLMSRR